MATQTTFTGVDETGSRGMRSSGSVVVPISGVVEGQRASDNSPRAKGRVGQDINKTWRGAFQTIDEHQSRRWNEAQRNANFTEYIGEHKIRTQKYYILPMRFVDRLQCRMVVGDLRAVFAKTLES